VCLATSSYSSFAQTITVTVFDSNEKALPNVVVYLEPPKNMTLAVSNKTLEITQIDKSFSPYIGVMQKGGSVKFQNKDNITHHIYSPVGDNRFAFKLKAGKERIKNDFPTAGTVAMGCNIHDWMSGHLLILETPYFAKTDEMGKVSINVAQGGEYKVVVWHPQMREKDHRMSQMITLDNTATVNMTLLKPLAQLPTQKTDEDFDFLSDY